MSTTINWAIHGNSPAGEFLWDEKAFLALQLGDLLEPNGAQSVVNLVAADGSKLVLSGNLNVTSPGVTGTLTAFEVWQGSQQIISAAFIHTVDVAALGVGTGTINTVALVIEALQEMFGQESVTAHGSADSDLIYGGHWDDTLNGGGLNDSLTGYEGNDVFNGGAGWDDARYNRETGHLNVIANLSSTTRTVGLETIAAGTAFDTYGFTDTLTGIEFISGSPGYDWFFGSDGGLADDPKFASGGEGDDHYVAGSAAFGVAYDVLEVENGGAGVVINLSAATVAGLAARTGRDTYGDTDYFTGVNWLSGSDEIDRFYGGATGEHLFGRGGNDTIGGGGGKDRIEGDDGKDSLDGGGGKDTISGGAQRDVMTGGAAADRFQYTALLESGITATKRDYIKDFVHGVDDIDLQAIDANSTKAGNQSFILDGKGSAALEIAKRHMGWYQIDKAGKADDRTIIKLNVDNDSAIEMSIELKGLITLTAGDFIL